MALMMTMMTPWAIKRVWGSKDELLPERRLLPQLAAPAVLYGHITSQMMTVLLLIIMMTMLTIHKTAHDDYDDVVRLYYFIHRWWIYRNVTKYALFVIKYIQTWPNIMITLGSGEDLVPEQENEVEKQQRARTAGSGEKMALPCSVFTDILNLVLFKIFSILPCCVFLDISNLI